MNTPFDFGEGGCGGDSHTVTCGGDIQKIKALNSKYFCVGENNTLSAGTQHDYFNNPNCALAWNACCEDNNCDKMRAEYPSNTYECGSKSDLSTHFDIDVRGCKVTASSWF